MRRFDDDVILVEPHRKTLSVENLLTDELLDETGEFFTGRLALPLRQRMALFDVNTGLRDQELCNLQWSWEQRVPELDTSEIKRSVFVLPATSVKNRQARAVILNDVAQSVLEEARGEHPVYVFTWENRRGRRHRVGHFRNSGWIQARRRAAARYVAELGKQAAAGFKNVRVHDLRHTFGGACGRLACPSRTARTSWATAPHG